MGKRGPKAGATTRKEASIGARIAKETRDRLVSAARANGRSLSEELEIRLQHSLGRTTAEESLLDLIGECIRRSKEFAGRDWVNDRACFDLMLGAIVALLKCFRPEESGAPLRPGFLMQPGLPSGVVAKVQELIDSEGPTAFSQNLVDQILHTMQIAAGRTGRVPELYERAAKHLRGLLTTPFFEDFSRKEP